MVQIGGYHIPFVGKTGKYTSTAGNLHPPELLLRFLISFSNAKDKAEI